MDKSDENMIRLKLLAEQMVSLADEAIQEDCDDRCFILYGLTRDYGYRIMAEAERECQSHDQRRKGGR